MLKEIQVSHPSDFGITALASRRSSHITISCVDVVHDLEVLDSPFPTSSAFHCLHLVGFPANNIDAREKGNGDLE